MGKHYKDYCSITNKVNKDGRYMYSLGRKQIKQHKQLIIVNTKTWPDKIKTNVRIIILTQDSRIVRKRANI